MIYYSTPQGEVHFINFPKVFEREHHLCSAGKAFCCWMHTNRLKAPKNLAMQEVKRFGSQEFCPQLSLCTSI